MKKTYYYHFKKIDTCFWAMVLAFIMTFVCCGGWGAKTLFIITTLIWIYKDVLGPEAIVITDKTIKIDHSAPLAWKDIKDAGIKTVRLCGYRDMKILSLNPKAKIKYTYNFMQKRNAGFGPFPIPLYGILAPKDEKEILQIVKKHVKVKGK